MVDSIVMVVLKSTAGWLFNRGRNYTAKRLRSDGGMFNHRLSMLIESDFSAIKNELEAERRKDLLDSISRFEEGIISVRHQKVTSPSDTVDGPTNPKRGRSSKAQAIELGALASASVGVDIKAVLNYDCNHTARKRFQEARQKSGSALSNSALSNSDSVLATGIKILATLLETEDSTLALNLCRYDLQKIHSRVAGEFKTELEDVPKVSPKKLKKNPENREIMWYVCRLNQYVFDVAQKVGGDAFRELFIWPCVEISSGTGNEKQEIDPLRDPRLDKIFRKERRESCSVVWSFGQKGSKKQHKLNLPSSIAASSEGWFLIVDNGEPKLFDNRGKFQKCLPIRHDADIRYHVVDGDIDENGNVYLLVSLTNDTHNPDEVQVFDKDGNAKLQDNFQLVRENKYKACKLAVNQNEVLVLKRELDRDLHSKIEIYQTKSDKCQFTGHFGEGILVDAVDIVCGNDRHIFVLDKCETRPDKKCVREFIQLKAYDSFVVDYSSTAVAFHRASGHIVIASKNEQNLWLSFYTTDGKIKRIYSLSEAEIVSNPSITVTTKGRIAVALAQNVHNRRQGKVIVY